MKQGKLYMIRVTEILLHHELLRSKLIPHRATRRVRGIAVLYLPYSNTRGWKVLRYKAGDGLCYNYPIQKPAGGLLCYTYPIQTPVGGYCCVILTLFRHPGGLLCYT